MIDSHCHLNHEKFYSSAEGFIAKAMGKGVEGFLVVGYDLASSQKALELAKRFPNVYAAVGIHPTDIKKRGETDLEQIEKMLSHPKVIAYGEIGLDYHWDKEENEQALQREYFIKQINVANRNGKPVIIHTRDAAFDTYKILSTHQVQRSGIMHCYSGSVEMVDSYVKLGYYIALGGPVTFTNAKTPKEVANHVPLDYLLIETDAPYLAPHPLRGQQNEPSNLPLILNEIANIRGISPLVLDEATTANFRRLFKLEKK
ncbi:MAG: TatD family deoxyribonuclease [Bacteroidia bacterium]|nr:TatD family deoxyribonuclease [Bacteroidia bacterium]